MGRLYLNDAFFANAANMLFAVTFADAVLCFDDASHCFCGYYASTTLFLLIGLSKARQ